MKLRVLVLITLVALSACAQRPPQCTCEDDEKWNGEACVAALDFTPPSGDCIGPDAPVCGCDGVGYTSECAATEAGVQVLGSGTCESTSPSSSNGGGGGFGW